MSVCFSLISITKSLDFLHQSLEKWLAMCNFSSPCKIAMDNYVFTLFFNSSLFFSRFLVTFGWGIGLQVFPFDFLVRNFAKIHRRDVVHLGTQLVEHDPWVGGFCDFLLVSLQFSMENHSRYSFKGFPFNFSKRFPWKVPVFSTSSRFT